MKVLVVDDEKIKRITLRDDLREENYDTIAVESPAIALQLFQNEHFDVLVTDLRMPKMHGIEFLKRVKKDHPHVTVIIMTAYASVETAVEAMRWGAYNYIKKPFSSGELIAMLDKLKEIRDGIDKGGLDPHPQTSHLEPWRIYQNIIGKSRSVQEILNLIETISDSNANVLISGENGTGKELLAKSIHLNSPRGHHPFASVNCASVSEAMLELEIFGRECPPEQRRVGRFELAHKGTLFLDDPDSLPMSLQIKLLRTLEFGAFERVGGDAQIEVDVRVIAATTENLREKVQNGAFLEDLFYRLNVVPIFLPPLRERVEDISLLINHFLELFSPNQLIPITQQAVELLAGYPWPGNVRELENMVERLVAVSGGREITADAIPIDLKLGTHIRLNDPMSEVSFHDIIRSTERDLIAWAMKKSNGNKTQAAKLLKMKPSTFRDALAKNIDQIEWDA